nr:hypothetical protein QZH41_001351 [Actinostola sp. cb2023]
MGIASLGRAIYVIGGSTENGHNVLDSVERYDPMVNQWTEVAPLASPRAGLSAAVDMKVLYAIGGISAKKEYSAPSTITAIDAYDPTENKWSRVANLCISRYAQEKIQELLTSDYARIARLCGASQIMRFRIRASYHKPCRVVKKEADFVTTRGFVRSTTGTLATGLILAIHDAMLNAADTKCSLSGSLIFEIQIHARQVRNVKFLSPCCVGLTDIKTEVIKGQYRFKIQIHGRLVTRHGATTMLITIPESDYIYDDMGRNRTSYVTQQGEKGRNIVNQMLRKFAGETDDVILCDLATEHPHTTPSEEDKSKYWDDGLHYTPKGYDKMGEIIFEKLKTFIF